MNNMIFIEDWNSIIPFKIKAADIEKPSEQFVYKAILHFFKLLHYDVSTYENMYNDAIETLTVKREFVARINYIYQLCSDSTQTTFFYVDLVKPTAKKVIHLLKILLNYLFYINMVKEIVLEKTGVCVERYFQLNAQLNQEQASNEENKIRADNVIRNIDGLKDQLPGINRQIEELSHFKDDCHEKLIVLKTNHQKLADKIVSLKLEHIKFVEQKVANEEAGVLKTTYETLNHDMGLLTEFENKVHQTNAIHANNICEIKPCIALLEILLQAAFDDLWKAKQNNTEELILECEKADKQYHDLLSLNEVISTNCMEIEAHLEDRQQELVLHLKMLDKNERKNDSKLEALAKYVQNLVETNELLEHILNMQRLEMWRIIKMSKSSMDIITKTTVEEMKSNHN